MVAPTAVGDAVATTASLLFDGSDVPATDGAAAGRPAYFRDLNLDQVVDRVLEGLDEFRLGEWYHTRLRHPAAVRYRQEVFSDLERPPLLAALTAFAGAMRTVRRRLALAEQMRHPLQKARWLLAAAGAYHHGVDDLRGELAAGDPWAPALHRALDFLQYYCNARGYRSLVEDVAAADRALASVRYTVHVKGGRVTVRRYGGEADYSVEVTRTFERFRQGAVGDYRVAFPDRPVMNHVEEKVLDRVARLFPEELAGLTAFEEHHRDFLDPTVAALDREAQFYLAYLRWVAPLRQAGLPFCRPEVSGTTGCLRVEDAFDLALAAKLAPDGSPVVRNDVRLEGPERILVVSGPNQGGKTTFARMVGQLHHMAALGCPVPGTAATLLLRDEIFTHFEREEDLEATGGRLADDLSRMQAILQRATPESLVVVNEIFTSTTLEDAAFLGREAVERLIALGASAVYVTFVDELASLGPSTVSMVSTVAPEDPSRRTYRVVRRPADGRAYAVVLAEKYELTEGQLRQRLSR